MNEYIQPRVFVHCPFRHTVDRDPWGTVPSAHTNTAVLPCAVGVSGRVYDNFPPGTIERMGHWTELYKYIID